MRDRLVVGPALEELVAGFASVPLVKRTFKAMDAGIVLDSRS